MKFKIMNLKNLVGVVLLTALLSLTSCRSKQQTVQEIQKVKVEVAVTEYSEVDQVGTFTATVQAETTNNISPQSGGRIKRIRAEVGDRVGAGQILAEMDAVNLDQTKLQMENYKLEFERMDELYKIGGISKSTWDQQKLAYDLSVASYENILENTYLRSPISGIVTERNYDTGDVWSMGSPIYVVEQIRPVKLIVNVSESLYTRVRKGMQVDVQLDVYGSEEFTGTVKLIHPSVDPGTRTFTVEITIPNADERIRPGMFARVTFNYGTENHITVADRAIVKQAGAADRFVYVIQNGVAKHRVVQLGRLVGDRYEVLSGLTEGETIAITALNRLEDGTEVEIVNR